ncbi:MAG TPA: hypothetical protein QGF02_00165, partial [Candidatus Babeliales bacterium]|nr:hypothetical protein [Candidatus Babeliales bacterium]
DLTIDAISFTDLSPDTGTFSKENSDWIILKDNIDRILNAYGINSYQNPFKKTVPGDLVGMIGWQRVFKEIPGAVIDLFSINLKVGFSFPTGSTLDPSEPFALQGGHLKHVGLVGTANLLIGFASYLELGLEVNGMKFIDKTVTRRMKTAVDQSGFIELASGKAYEKLGDRYGITPYTVFHPPFMSNLSMLVAYSYQRHTKKELCPKNTIVFDSAIVNAMNTEFTWSLIHLKLNYMLNYFPCIKPNIGLLVDIPVGGKHIFNTTMAGGAIGLNLNWSF